MANPKGNKIGEKITRKELMDMMKSMRQKEFDKKSAQNKKPATTPKYDANGKRIFSGTGTTKPAPKTPNFKMIPNLSGSIPVAPAKPKAKPAPKKMPKLSGKMFK
jgi:hypothetical protein